MINKFLNPSLCVKSNFFIFRCLICIVHLDMKKSVLLYWNLIFCHVTINFGVKIFIKDVIFFFFFFFFFFLILE